MRHVSIAFWTYVTPMTSARAFKITIILTILFCVGAALAMAGGAIDEDITEAALTGLQHIAILMAVPLGAAVLGEMSLRDGITHRTLLYPLLGPVPRATQALVRTGVTMGLVAALGTILLLLVRFLMMLQLGEDLRGVPSEVVSIWLASFAYVALFGLVHLLNQRGLIFALIYLFMFDMPVGRVPFSVRNVSLSYHVAVVSDHVETTMLPIPVDAPASSVFWSSIVLLAVGTICLAVTAHLFDRRDLGELC